MIMMTILVMMIVMFCPQEGWCNVVPQGML